MSNSNIVKVFISRKPSEVFGKETRSFNEKLPIKLKIDKTNGILMFLVLFFAPNNEIKQNLSRGVV